VDDDQAPQGDKTPASTSSSYSLSISGLDQEPADALAKLVQNVVNISSQVLDLRSLEGITFTPTYAETLANFDRGFQATKVLKPTQEEFAVGAAMLVHVKRGDEFRCHLVVDAGIGAATVSGDPEMEVFGVGLLFHEMGHVHDFRKQCEMMPDLMFKPLPNTLESWLYNATSGVWSEFFACYVAAPADEKALDRYLETFIIALKKIPEEVRENIISYRTQGDLGALTTQVENRFGSLFKYASYVLGHLEGMETTLQQEAPESFAEIEQLGFGNIWLKLEEALKTMLSTYPKWTGIDAYNQIGMIFSDYLKERGIFLSPLPTSFHVDIPKTRTTMPPESHYLFDLHQVEVLE